jgi:hypothetical protein
MMPMSVLSISFESASSDAYVVDTSFVKPSTVVTVVPDAISVEPSVGAEYELVVLIATQADPDHTPIIPVVELKYSAPVISALPSLSNVGAVDLAPR